MTACLVCGRAGLPDRAVDPVRQEKATFVVRRLFPPGLLDINSPLPPFNAATWEEYALVSGSSGDAWRRIPRAPVSQTVASRSTVKRQLSMFAMNFTEDDGRRRRLFAGLV